jgi:hypothetical protein
MTDRTVGKLRLVNVVFFDEPPSKRELVLGWHPVHIVDLLTWPNVFLWCTVAVKAPGHVQGMRLLHQRHLIHLAMTGSTADTFLDVDTVIEINMIGEIMNPIPLEWRASAPAFPNWLQHISISPDLRVARHAGLCRRDTSERGLFYRCVAVQALDPETADMVLMAELDRLLNRNIDPC